MNVWLALNLVVFCFSSWVAVNTVTTTGKVLNWLAALLNLLAVAVHLKIIVP